MAIRAVTGLLLRYPTGGMAHVEVDDENLEDEFLDYALANDLLEPGDSILEWDLSLSAVRALRALSLENRRKAVKAAKAIIEATEGDNSWFYEWLDEQNRPTREEKHES